MPRHTLSVSDIARALFFALVVGGGAFLAIGLYAELPIREARIAILVPSILCGLLAFVFVLWRAAQGESRRSIWQSLKDAVDVISGL